MNGYAVLAAAAAAVVVAGICGLGLALYGTDPQASPFRSRTSRVRLSGASILSHRRLLRGVIAVAGAAAVWVLTGWPVAGLLTAVFVATASHFFGGAKIANARIERLEAVEQWVRHLSDSMSAGTMPVQTIVRSADHAPAAIADPVRRLATRLSTPQLDKKKALTAFADDIDDALGDLVVLALQRAVDTRGSERVPQVLQTLAEAVAAEVKARRAIEKDRAGPRKETQTICIFLAAFIGGLSVFTAYPAIYGSVEGQLVLLALGGVALLALFMMRRLSIGGQPPRILASAQESSR